MISSRSMNREKLLLAAGCAALIAAVANAQTSTPAPTAPSPLAPPYKNLQVFPKDIPQQELVTNMKFFAQSLGVRCVHCHVGEEGKPLSTFDFASDAKKEKQTARAMLRMVHRINSEDFGVKDFSNVRVTCYTCHRGALKPATFPPSEPAAKPAASTERG